MERKSLGRGIEDISDIFISARKDKKTSGGFSSKKLRDATCESCTNIIRHPQKTPECKIFTLENKTYGVRYMETLSPSSANYCEFFEPILADNNYPGSIKEPPPNNTEIECRIEEFVAVRKNITYAPSPNAQQHIFNSLSRYLEENYTIKSIELRKTHEILRPGKIKYIDEDVTICIEDRPDESRLSPEEK
jgi:hypothetical protein